MSLNLYKVPMIEVKSSGALPPAAIRVAPATSSDISSFSIITFGEFELLFSKISREYL